MAKVNLDSTLIRVFNELSAYWEESAIQVLPDSSARIKRFENENHFLFPQDIFEFYRRFNVMRRPYPYDTDKNGFVFHSLDTLRIEKNNYKIWNGDDFVELSVSVIIFCDYMQSSWEYAMVFDSEQQLNYTICIMPSPDVLTPICNKLSDFLQYYINDDEILYEYKL